MKIIRNVLKLIVKSKLKEKSQTYEKLILKSICVREL